MTNNQIEKIEKFLSGQMAPQERKRFELELESDKELLAAYNTYRDVEKHMFNPNRHAGEDAVKSSLKKLGAEFFNTVPKTNNGIGQKDELHVPVEAAFPAKSKHATTMQIWKLAAAVFIGVVAMGAWYLFTNDKNVEKQAVQIPALSNDSAGRQEKTPDTMLQTPAFPNVAKLDTEKNNPAPSNVAQRKLLFAKYFQTDTVPANKDEHLDDAFAQYESGQYKKAVIAFENGESDLSVRGEDTDNTLAIFYASYYKALSLMVLDKDIKAIHELKQLAGADGFLQVKVSWYLALCYVRTGNDREAISLLKKINDNNAGGDYKLKANELITALQSLP